MRLTIILSLLCIKLMLMYVAQLNSAFFTRKPDLPFLSFPNSTLNVAHQTIVNYKNRNNYEVYKLTLPYAPKKFVFSRQQPPQYNDVNYIDQKIDGDVLIIVDDNGFLVSHYFHFMEHLVGVWNFLTYQHPERVKMIIFAFADTSLKDQAWRNTPNNSTELLLKSLFPNASVQNLNNLPRNLNLKAENIYVSSRIRSHLTRPAGYINMNGVARSGYKLERLQQMRDRIFDAMQIQVQPPGRQLRITYCKRTGRRVLEESLEQQLLSAISKETGQPVHVVDFAKISFTEQLQIIANTDLLIGVHGNGLTHLLFLPDNATVLEYHEAEKTAFYRVFAQLRGLRYYGNSNKLWFTEKYQSLEDAPEQPSVTALDLQGTIDRVQNLKRSHVASF